MRYYLSQSLVMVFRLLQFPNLPIVALYQQREFIIWWEFGDVYIDSTFECIVDSAERLWIYFDRPSLLAASAWI